MNKILKIALLVSVLFFIVGTNQQVSAAESFYVQLDIKEIVVGSKINFSFDKAAPLYGDYESFADVYNQDTSNGEYILETYDSQKQKLVDYSLRSSRITYYDTETGGGIIEADSGVIIAIIPYDVNNPVSYIKIDNQGTKTSFMVIPTAQLAQQIAAIPLCGKENESLDITGNKCCSGLIASPQEDDSYICVNCGDGKCAQYESYNSCPLDCENPFVVASDNSSENGKLSFALIASGLLGSLLLILLIILVLVVSNRRRKDKERLLPPMV